MQVTINNEKEQLPDNTTVAQLLELKNLTQAAVAINGTVVRRADFDTTLIQPNDDILLIKPAYGG